MIKGKKFFSYGLYKEGLRQSRTLGLVGLVTILVLILFTWMGCPQGEHDYAHASHEVLLYGSEAVAVLLMQYCLFSPFMVLGLFQYLNKRDASDAYHAMPHSRESVHISYFAGVMSWNAIVVISAVVLAMALYGFAPGMALNLSEVFPFAFNMFAASFSVAASVLFAMSITGTRFTNIVVSLLVIFLPRLLLNSFANMVNTVAVIVDVQKQFSFLNPSLNVAAGIPLNVFSVFSDDSAFMDCLLNPWNGAYTLGLGLLTFGAALWLLHHRKSESAGKSSPNRVLQAVYRVALGFTLGLIPVSVILNAIVEDDIDNSDFVLVILILVFFVALAYFLFELFTTKKAKNMVKAIPTFLLVLVLNGIFLGSVYFLGNNLLHYTPDASEITSFTLVVGDERNYFSENHSHLDITDAPSKVLVSKILEDSVKRVEEGRLHSISGYLYGDYYNETYRMVEVCISGNQGKQYRHLLMPNEDYTFIVTAMESSEDFKQSLYQIPTPQTHNMTYGVDESGFTQEQNLAVYNALVEDIKAMPFEQWYPMSASIDSVGGATGMDLRAFSVSCTLVQQGKEYYFYYPITKTLTPKAFDLILQYLSQKPGNDLQAFATRLEQVAANQTEYEDYDIVVTVLHPIEEYFAEGGDWHLAVQNLMEYAKPYTPGTQDVVVELALTEYNNDNYNGPPETVSVYFMVEREHIDPYLTGKYTVYD